MKYLCTFLILTGSVAAAQTTPGLDFPPPASQTSIPSYMIISPTSRALDFQQAFEMLRKEKSSGKVFFELVDGSTIGNVIEMTVMPNSTLILFRFNSAQGVQHQIVKVEDIVTLRY